MSEISDLLPEAIARRERVVPINVLRSTVVLACSQPISQETSDRLSFILNRELRFVLRSDAWIDAELDSRYQQSSSRSEDMSDNWSVSFYWPDWHYLDGTTLVVKASGWSPTSHWTGALILPLAHPDRAFWDWLVRIPTYHRVLDERELPKIRRIWLRYCRRCGGANMPDRDGRAAPS
jgi:type II secretory ATPase GspE/PulE/Tfp pilus assembly ATPase PilB-like protein